ncbi:glycosyltransferase family 39 protein [bacterium]|nr:glycosyltransferase family 39 protein [bacterium]
MDKRDIRNILTLVVLLVVGFVLNFAHSGKLLEDCGREAFLPTVAFSPDFVMYKDIFNLYPPFSYQFNAILYGIFGEHLNTLYFAGLVNTAVILCTLYFIAKKFLDTRLSFVVALFTLLYSVFGYFSASIEFIFPYAFAYVYALSTFLLSLLFFLNFLESEDKPYWLMLSALFCGLSIANKFEFALTPIVYIVALVALKSKITPVHALSSLCLVGLPSFLSFGYVILSGWGYADILEYLDFGKRFFATESYKEFSSASLVGFEYGLIFFKEQFWGFIPLMCVMFLKPKRKATVVLNDLLITAFTLFGAIIYYVHYKQQIISLSWLCISALFICIFLLVKVVRNFSRKDFIFLMTIVIFLLASMKINFFLAKNTYGNYLIPFFVFLHVVFIKNYCTKFCNAFDCTKFFSIVLVTIGLLSSFMTIATSAMINSYRLTTDKGTIYVEKYWGSSFEGIMKHLDEAAPRNASVLVMQEGVMMNFFMDRPTNLKLYHLVKIHVETLGEDYVVRELESNPTDYVALFKTDALTPKIMECIKRNYTVEKTFIHAILMKRKKNW